MNSISEYDNGLDFDDLDDCWDDKSINSEDSAPPPPKKLKASAAKTEIVKKKAKVAIIKVKDQSNSNKMSSVSEYDNGLDLDDNWINSEDSAPPPPKKSKSSAGKTEIVKKKAEVALIKVKDQPISLTEKKKVPKKVSTLEKQVSKAHITIPASTKSDTLESEKPQNTGESSFPLDQFDLTESTIQLLKDRGIESLFPIQAETFWPIRQGKDLIGRARTGQGKS